MSDRPQKSLMSRARKLGFACEWLDELGYLVCVDDETVFNDNAWELLSAMTPVGVIYVYGEITDGALEALLCSCPEILVVGMYEGGLLTDNCAECFSQCRKLVTLELHNANISDEFLAAAQLPKTVWSLDFTNCPITDRALKYVASTYPHLRNLGLQSTCITDDGIRHLESMSDLLGVNLRRCDVGDRSFKSLDKMHNLKMVLLRNTKVSRARAERFAASRPNCLVVVTENDDDILLNEERWDEKSFSDQTAVI